MIFAAADDGLQLLANGRRPAVTDPGIIDGTGEVQARLRRPDEDEKSKRDDVAKGQLLPPSLLRSSAVLSAQHSELTPEQQVDHAFLLVLARHPSEAERAQIAAIYDAADGDETAALERVFWVLLNTDR